MGNNMTSQVTPSKTAATGIESLKMGDSPAKKLNFGAANKENEPLNTDAPVFEDIEVKKPVVEDVKKAEIQAMVAKGFKPGEADEPLLRENAQRFVLSPSNTMRSGRCTRRQRHLSG